MGTSGRERGIYVPSQSYNYYYFFFRSSLLLSSSTQLVGGFTLSDLSLMDKLWSQVSSLPPGTCLQFLSRIGFSIPTARRFSSNVANCNNKIIHSPGMLKASSMVTLVMLVYRNASTANVFASTSTCTTISSKHT